MLSSKPSYLSTIEISKLVETKLEVKFMFDKLELIYGRPVTSTEQRSYIYLYEAAGNACRCVGDDCRVLRVY